MSPLTWCLKLNTYNYKSEGFFLLVRKHQRFDFPIDWLDRLSEFFLSTKTLQSSYCRSVGLAGRELVQSVSIITRSSSARPPRSFASSRGMSLESVIICRLFKVKQSCQSCQGEVCEGTRRQGGDSAAGFPETALIIGRTSDFVPRWQMVGWGGIRRGGDLHLLSRLTNSTKRQWYR